MGLYIAVQMPLLSLAANNVLEEGAQNGPGCAKH